MPNPELSRRQFLRLAGGIASASFLAACDIPGVPDSSKNSPVGQRITLDQPATVTPTVTSLTERVTPTVILDQRTATVSSLDQKETTPWQLPADYKYILDSFTGMKVAYPTGCILGAAPTGTQQDEAKEVADTGKYGIEFYVKSAQLSFLGQIGFRRVPKLFTLEDCFTDEATQLNQLLAKRKSATGNISPVNDVKIISPYGTFTEVKQMIASINASGEKGGEVDMQFSLATTGFLQKVQNEEQNKFWMFSSYTSPVFTQRGIQLMETSLKSIILS